MLVDKHKPYLASRKKGGFKISRGVADSVSERLSLQRIKMKMKNDEG